MEDRSQIRSKVSLDARIRPRDRLAFPVEVIDLAERGCRLKCVPLGLRRMDKVTVSISSMAPIPGEIRWIHSGFEAGIEFDRALHPVVLANFIEQMRREYNVGIIVKSPNLVNRNATLRTIC